MKQLFLISFLLFFCCKNDNRITLKNKNEEVVFEEKSQNNLVNKSITKQIVKSPKLDCYDKSLLLKYFTNKCFTISRIKALFIQDCFLKKRIIWSPR